MLQNTRFHILLITGVLVVLIYVYVVLAFQTTQLQIIRLTQIYALTSVAFLYVTLCIGPLSRLMQGSFIQEWLHARRAFGVSAFLFAFLHANFAFFGQLGGFGGLFFLSPYYLLGISLSFISLTILGFMASTSFDSVVAKLTFKKWKRIHQLVYIAGIFILIHALLLGTHFHDLSAFIPFALFMAVTLLLILHASCWEKRLRKKLKVLSQYKILSLVVVFIMSSFYFLYMIPSREEGGGSAFSVHTTHSSRINGKDAPVYMPGMEGDPSKSAAVEFIAPDTITAQKQTKLDFKITNASNNEPLYYFQTPFEKPFHLIIVNSDLSYFSHIHPVQNLNNFSVETVFPSDGLYYLYSDLQPFGMREQQSGFTVQVGSGRSADMFEPDFGKEKVVDEYIVTIDYEPLESKKMNAGDQEFRFSVFDTNMKPVASLHPYLGAFGHLVMIKKDTYDYVHAHPVMSRPVRPNELSGPNVLFVPMPLSGNIEPGIYKLFGQFNPNGKLITAEFWVEVK